MIDLFLPCFTLVCAYCLCTIETILVYLVSMSNKNVEGKFWDTTFYEIRQNVLAINVALE
jgi:hypothetical protein